MEWVIHLTFEGGGQVSVPSMPFLIGKGPECHLRLNRKFIGKRHCQILLGQTETEAFDEEQGEDVIYTEPAIYLLSLTKDHPTMLDRDILQPRAKAFLIPDRPYLLVLGSEKLHLAVERHAPFSRRGSNRQYRSPGSKRINRGGRLKERVHDEFEESLRLRRS